MHPNAGPTLKSEIALHPTLFPNLYMGSEQTDGDMDNFLVVSNSNCASSGLPHETAENSEMQSTPAAAGPVSSQDSMSIIGDQAPVAWNPVPPNAPSTLEVVLHPASSTEDHPAPITCCESTLDLVSGARSSLARGGG
jgi:hypothetical protein